MTGLVQLLDWVRLRLAAGRGQATALGLITLVTVCCAVAAPRVVGGQETEALRTALGEAPLLDRSVNGEALPERYLRQGDEWLAPKKLDGAAEAFAEVIRPPLRFDPADVVYGARNNTHADAPDPGLPRFTRSKPPEAVLYAQAGDLTDHAELVAGRAPAATIGGPANERRVEVALTTKTAKTMKLSVGDSYTLQSPQGVTVATVSGLVEPLDPDHPYWRADPKLAEPNRVVLEVPGGDPTIYWEFGALLDREAAPVLRDIRDGALLYWHHPIDTDALTVDRASAAGRGLTSLTSGAASTRLDEKSPVGPIEVTSELTALLADFETERRSLTPLLLIAAIGVGTAAGTVLLMTAALGVERRRAELALLRARGASLPSLLARLLAENAATVLPAAALGTAATLALTPDHRTGTALLLAGAATLLALLAGPLRAVLEHRRYVPADARRDLSTAKPSRRRTVAELTTLVLVCAAVVAVRGRSGEDGTDPLTAAAPVLLSLAAAIVLLRLHPLPLRLLGRATRRLRGPVAFLGLARAGRAPAGAGLPLLALVVTLTVAAFGGAVLTGVADARERAALATVGADARIADTLGLPPEVKERADRVPGVADSLLLRSDNRGEYEDGSPSQAFFLVVVDPEAYAALAERTGFGPFPAHRLADNGTDTLPALVSPQVAERIGESGDISASNVRLTIRPVLTRTVTPAVTSGQFAVVSAEAVARLKTAPKDLHITRPTTLLVTATDGRGDALDSAALHAAAREVDPDSTVSVRADERAGYADSPLQSGAGAFYLAALAVAAGYSALALLLSLLQTAPDRARQLARLRAMGLTRSQTRRLLTVELLPQYALAITGGILTSVAAVVLLRSGVDLTASAGTAGAGPAAGTAELLLSPAVLALPALGVLALGGTALLAQAWLLTRRGRPTDLRTVD